LTMLNVLGVYEEKSGPITMPSQFYTA
jgi:hypothetical protein